MAALMQGIGLADHCGVRICTCLYLFAFEYNTACGLIKICLFTRVLALFVSYLRLKIRLLFYSSLLSGGYTRFQENPGTQQFENGKSWTCADDPRSICPSIYCGRSAVVYGGE